MCWLRLPQANVEPTSAPSGWPLESLAAKMRQYCPLLDPERVNADALAAAVCRILFLLS